MPFTKIELYVIAEVLKHEASKMQRDDYRESLLALAQKAEEMAEGEEVPQFRVPALPRF